MNINKYLNSLNSKTLWHYVVPLRQLRIKRGYNGEGEEMRGEVKGLEIEKRRRLDEIER